MNERFTQYRDKAVQYWNQTTRIQRLVFISSAILLVLITSITVYNLSKTEYSTAFKDLDTTDAAAITAYLNDQGISYKLSNDGKSIGVPSTIATQVKIDVESQGLMKNGSIGYGIFKENISSFGMTDNEFGVLKKDADAGEIQQLINSLDGVTKSKVVIYLPEETVFLNESTGTASASAVITFRPGFRPEQGLIDTIYNLVTHSLPQIDQEHITISDTKGELLPSTKMAGGVENASALVAQQFMIKKQFENEIQRNVQSLLSNFFKPDKVAVSVISSLNFDKKNSVQQLVTPVNTDNNKGIELSVEKIQESYSGEGGGTSGVPGTGEGDVPGYPSSDSTGSYESETLTERINYDVNRISNEIISSPFQVKDLTINVAVEPPDKTDPASLTEETKDAIQQILSNIVAASLADSDRVFTEEEINKKVFVLAHSFDGVTTEEPAAIWQSPLFYGLAAVALAVIVVGTLLAFRRRTPQIQEEDLQLAAPGAEIPSIDMETVSNESQVRKQLEALAHKRPEEFVNLLRTWLVDE